MTSPAEYLFATPSIQWGDEVRLSGVKQEGRIAAQEAVDEFRGTVGPRGSKVGDVAELLTRTPPVPKLELDGLPRPAVIELYLSPLPGRRPPQSNDIVSQRPELLKVALGFFYAPGKSPAHSPARSSR